MQKHTIKNSSGLKLVIQVDTSQNPKHLVFIAHGQGGFKEQKHIELFAQAFLENDFRVVRFDATNALGESDGDMMNVTYDNYVHDLEDVINWARQQPWFQQPFALCGHSMGAQSTAWYAEQHPDEVSLLLPMAPPVNSALFEKTRSKTFMRDWREKGYWEMNSKSKPGVIKRVGYGVVESLHGFDLLPLAPNLTMPILIVVGQNDEPCPVAHQEIFMNKIASKDKKLVVKRGLDHNYRNAETSEYDASFLDMKSIISQWIYTQDQAMHSRS